MRKLGKTDVERNTPRLGYITNIKSQKLYSKIHNATSRWLTSEGGKLLEIDQVTLN